MNTQVSRKHLLAREFSCAVAAAQLARVGLLIYSCVVLCCVVLCCAVLCCAVLCCVVLCCAVYRLTYLSTNCLRTN
jgi:hypothetical protein